MDQPQIFTVYKGDTFLAECGYRSSTGTPVSMEGVQVSAYLKGRNEKIYPISVEIRPEIGQYRLFSETNDWPLGRSTLVIRYIAGGITRTASPVLVEVQDV